MVAVSGGVDSMVLLDILRRQPGVELLVAHVNHGLRADAAEDEKLVAHYALSHNIACVSTKLSLDRADEATARTARYSFLRQCCKEINARGILLAHHQDDLIETTLINHIRGTGWRGQAPFIGSVDCIRPLQFIDKQELLGYARRHNVPWREDATNNSQVYLRNYVRHSLIPLLEQKKSTWRDEFLQHIRKQQALRRTIDAELENVLKPRCIEDGRATAVDRHLYIMAPELVGLELLAHLLKASTGSSLERSGLTAALLFVKTGKPGKVMPLGKDWRLRLTKYQIIVEPLTPVVS